MPDLRQEELVRVYANRFESVRGYRERVWSVLVRNFFQRFVPEGAVVLDLGCGYGEFINAIRAGAKMGMDLNPKSRENLNASVQFLQQDCSMKWPLGDDELDLVFTSISSSTWPTRPH